MIDHSIYVSSNTRRELKSHLCVTALIQNDSIAFALTIIVKRFVSGAFQIFTSRQSGKFDTFFPKPQTTAWRDPANYTHTHNGEDVRKLIVRFLGARHSSLITRFCFPTEIRDENVLFVGSDYAYLSLRWFATKKNAVCEFCRKIKVIEVVVVLIREEIREVLMVFMFVRG